MVGSPYPRRRGVRFVCAKGWLVKTKLVGYVPNNEIKCDCDWHALGSLMTSGDSVPALFFSFAKLDEPINRPKRIE